MQPNSEAKPPTTTTAREAVVGHVEKVVQARATTPAPEAVWQGVQEGVQAVKGRALALAQAVQVAVVIVAQAVQVAVSILVSIEIKFNL